MKLSQLAACVACQKVGFYDCEITSLCADSRISSKGDLFFCFQGGKFDSHAVAREAERRGASAVVCERKLDVSVPQLIVENGREAMALLSAEFYHNPQKHIQFIAITGTNGKTTTAHLVYSILSCAGKRAGIIGTLGARYGKQTVAPDLTTPDPISLFALLSDMCKNGVEYVVMEVSAHALALKKVAAITFDVAVFTNLTQDHLDFFHNMTAYGNAKKLLFQPNRCRYAVLNADDAFCTQLNEVKNMTYGLENPADTFAVITSEEIGECRLLLNLSDELCECSLKLTGRHNVYNALAAATATRLLGVGLEAISQGISSCERVEGRLEWVGSARGAEIFVDFAHTPDGLEKSLLALRSHCIGRLICVFGCGGNRDSAKRPIMGETVAKFSDFAVITSDNPRYEDPCNIIYQIEEGYKKLSRRYVAVQEREKAIAYAVNMLSDGDILLIAGKGGEFYQEIMGIKYSYNDKDVVKRLIKG